MSKIMVIALIFKVALKSGLRQIINIKNYILISLYYDSKKASYPLINISDGKLSLAQFKQYNVLSYKFLEDCFKEFFKDYENTKAIENELIEFIKSKRTFKTNNLIKRTYKT